MRQLFMIILLGGFSTCYAQQQLPESEEELKEAILDIRTDVDRIQQNLYTSHKKLKVGIATASVGYSVTIIGGLMLGRENDDLGKALLYTGGAIGITGTIFLVDAFKYLGRAGKNVELTTGN